jgi:hypothetical protein
VIKHAPHLVNRELRPCVVNLKQPFDLDEIVASEGVHHLRDVIPHFGFDLARTVAEQQGKIRFARAFLPDFLGMNQEDGGCNLVRSEFARKRRLHLLLEPSAF